MMPVHATRAVAAVTAVLAAMSVWQVLARAVPEIPYAGMKAMSAAMNESPRDESAPWFVSRGIVPPPPASADEKALEAWLTKYYPVLALEPREMGANRTGAALDLGGGPPRVLYVEPSRGLVAREP